MCSMTYIYMKICMQLCKNEMCVVCVFVYSKTKVYYVYYDIHIYANMYAPMQK